MKKILLLLITVSLTLTSYAQFPEGFDGATFPPTGWASYVGANGLGTVENWKVEEFEIGNNTAVCVWEVLGAGQRSEDWLVTPQFTVDAATPNLIFDSIDSGTTDYGSIYTVRISTASQTTHADFTIIDTQTEADITHSQTTVAGSTHSVDLSAYAGQAIYVAFVLEQNDGDLWRIDNVNMVGVVNAPSIATNPSPADAATNVVIDTTDGPDADTDPDNTVVVSWSAPVTGDAPTSYDVFIGEDPAALVLGGNFADGTGVNWPGRAYSTTYYWQVVPKNLGGDAVNAPIWSFTTQADPALSINEDVLSSNVSIYPSTVDTQFTIENNSSIALVNAKIIDVNGRLVAKHNLNNLVGSTTIDVSNLNTGLYFVELNSNSSKLVKKIVKK